MRCILLALLLCLGTFAANATKWYSYKGIDNGSWNSSTTWTTIADGDDSYLGVQGIPAAGDTVYIVQNRTVVLTADVATINLVVDIALGSTIDMQAYRFSSGLIRISGQGTLKLASLSFPSATTNTLIAPGGGTVEYYNVSGTIPATPAVYNHLVFTSTNNSSYTFTLNSSLTVTGYLSLRRLTTGSAVLTLGGSATAVNLSVSGNSSVGTGCLLNVGSYNAVHGINLSGNLVNNGSISLSNQTVQYIDATTGAAILTFTGATNNTVSGVGATFKVYKMVVDKGSDQTFILDFNPSTFELWYRTDRANTGVDPNPTINKALWIKNGTLKLGSSVAIPKLTDQDIVVSGNDFFIPLNGCLWINGASVSITDNTGASSNTGLTVIGKLRISSGSLRGGKGVGIVFRGSAVALFEGGATTISQFRPSGSSGTNQAIYWQTGGTVTVNGSGETSTSYPRFALPLSTHSFIMSGGTLNVSSPIASGVALNGGILIGADVSNQGVTGGTVNVTVPSSAINFTINSTAPFFNLNISKVAGGAGVANLSAVSYNDGVSTVNVSALPQTINNDITIASGATLSALNNNLNIGRNFIVADGGTYTPGTNTTRFFYPGLTAATGSQLIVNNSALILPLYNFTLDKTGDGSNNYNTAKTLTLVGPTKAANAEFLTVSGTLWVNAEFNTLSSAAFYLNARGSVTVSGNTRFTQSTGGLLRLTGTSQQSLSLAGLSGGIDVLLNNSAGAILTEIAQLKNLTLTAGNLTIGGHQLTVSNPIGGTPFSVTKMVVTSGTSADGGLRYNLASRGAGTIVYPVGVSGKYTPFTLTLTGSGSFGTGTNYLVVLPVNSVHPVIGVGKEDSALKYYWDIQRNFSAGLPANLTAAYRFDFAYADRIIQNGGLRKGYQVIGASFNSTGTYNETNPSPNYIEFINNSFATSDFTGARNDAFNAQTGDVFESVASGNWNAIATWLKNGVAANSFPVAGDVVSINSDHTVTVQRNSEECDKLTILSGGVLDLQSYTGHTFNSLVGDGRLRLSTATLPTVVDNLATFTGTNSSTVEFYGAVGYTLPTLASYFNLIISGSSTKTMPNTNISIRNYFKIIDAPVLASNGTNGNITVAGLMHIEGATGSFKLRATNARTITVGSLEVLNSAILTVDNSGTATTHTLNVNGDVDVTGSIDLYGNGTILGNLYMKSEGSVSLGSSGNSIRINRLVIDKHVTSDEVIVTAELILMGPTNGTSKALEIIAGTLILDTWENSKLCDITLTSGGADFKIPSSGGLEVNRNNIVRVSGSDTGIDLDGDLDFADNAQGLLNGGINNYIQYSSSGDAEFCIYNNANVLLGSQFRFRTTEVTGLITYVQTGGSFSVGTVDAPTSNRSVFGITAGSSFTHTSGILSVWRSQVTPSLPAIVIEPSASNVSPTSTITIGGSGTPASSTIDIKSTIPLGSITVNTTNGPTAVLNTLPLSLTGSLTIGAGATFSTNNLDVSLNGNFVNSGTYSHGTVGTTYFTGVTQTISGSTTFLSLQIDASTSVSLAPTTTVTIQGNLNINSGIFYDGDNTINVHGNINNRATHYSNNPAAGGIVLNGSAQQVVNLNGVFGRLEINNAAGVVLNGDIYISNELKLSSGIFNIGYSNVELSPTAIITGGPFDVTRMIQTSGNLGDKGVTKTLTGPFSHFVPLGVLGKYTPLTATLTNVTGVGKVNCTPINTYHPTIVAPNGDPSRVLQYMWFFQTAGYTYFNGTIQTNYNQADVLGDENLYYAAFIGTVSNSWFKIPGMVNAGTNVVTYPYNNPVPTQFAAYFTAGEETAIPNIITTYTAINSGNWDTPTVWDKGAPPTEGVVVVIPSGVSVEITTNNKRVYQTRINGRLTVREGTTFHNLGYVTGVGTLALESGSFPTGNYDVFFTCNGGTIEYGGNSDYTISDKYTTMRNLFITGNSVKTLPNKDIIICENLTVNSGSLKLSHFGASSASFKYLTVRGILTVKADASLDTDDGEYINLNGNVVKEAGATINTDYTNQVVSFNGTLAQSVSGLFTSSGNRFNELRINNPTSVTFSQSANVLNSFLPSAGRLIMTNPAVLTLESNTAINSTSSVTYPGVVEGRLSRTLVNSGVKVNQWFPVGINGVQRTLELPSTSVLDQQWIAENKGVSYNSTTYTAPLVRVSTTEHWQVQGPAGESSKLSLRLEGVNDIEVSSLPADIRIAYWDGSTWREIAGGATVNTGVTPNTITTNLAFTFSGAVQYFTIATVGVTVLPTVRFTSVNTELCEGSTVSLYVEFTGTPNWTYKYTDGSVVTGPTTSTTSTTGFIVNPVVTTTYTLTEVKDNNGSVTGNVFGSPVVVTVRNLPTQYTVGGGGTSCGNIPGNVTLSNSQTGYTYELYLDGTQTGYVLAGFSGSSLNFTGITTSGTYTIFGYYTPQPGCGRLMTGSAVYTINPIPAVSISVLPTPTSCDGDPVTLTVTLTSGTAPFTYTYTTNGADPATRTTKPTPDTFLTPNLVWSSSGGAEPDPKIFSFSVVTIVDANGCTSNPTTPPNTSTLVYREPISGPLYYVPNNFAY